MKIADMKVTELINEVGSGTPAPGGGAVAGLAGGVGVALTMMVNGLTLDKTAMQSAWRNVLINLSSLKDKAFRDECCQKGEALLAHAVPIAQESYEKVLKVITEK